jgi:hypothetical protein
VAITDITQQNPCWLAGSDPHENRLASGQGRDARQYYLLTRQVIRRGLERTGAGLG